MKPQIKKEKQKRTKFIRLSSFSFYQNNSHNLLSALSLSLSFVYTSLLNLKSQLLLALRPLPTNWTWTNLIIVNNTPAEKIKSNLLKIILFLIFCQYIIILKWWYFLCLQICTLEIMKIFTSVSKIKYLLSKNRKVLAISRMAHMFD